jgi:hypothetical protein
MFCADDHRSRWVPSWEDIDEVDRSSHFHQKMMFAIFSNRTGYTKLRLSSRGIKDEWHILLRMCAEPSERKLPSTWQGTQERRVILHFDNALIHDIEMVQESLLNFGFRKMEQPPYGQD